MIIIADEKNPHSEIFVLPNLEDLPDIEPNERMNVAEGLAKEVKYPDDMGYGEAVKLLQQFCVGKEYVKQGINKATGEIVISTAKDDPQYVDINFYEKKIPFDRIRRITGYLTGTVDRWNNAKAAELQDRVKHFDARKEAEPASNSPDISDSSEELDEPDR